MSSLDSILNDVRKRGNKASLGAYLYSLMRAHPEAFLEAENMARKKRETLEEVFTRGGLIPEWIERGRVQGLDEGRNEERQHLLKMLDQGLSIEEIKRQLAG
jgi:hypothetical protein